MLHQKIEADLNQALKSGDKNMAGVLRFLIAAIKNYQIEERVKDKEHLSDEEITLILRKQMKQRKDSISEFRKGNRPDLVEKEESELAILSVYAPDQIDENKLREIVKRKINELGAKDKSDFGKLMGALMKELQGKADGGLIKEIAEKELSL